MKIKCFGCDETLSADSVEQLVDAFETHANEDHEWDYPMSSLRNYARNVAEATIRLTGPTKRFDSIGAIEVHPVTVDRIDDWLQFFDHDGFADNPEWASCYCLEPHGGLDEDEPLWTESRAAMVERFTNRTTEGYLAYVDGKVAGWVNASKRSDSSKYADVDPDGPPAAVVASVSCFVIAPPYRRHGVADSLLEFVLSDAASRGVDWVEAYPKPEVVDGDAENFKGTMAMYTTRGFDPIETHEHYTVMRKRV
jgi:GNAT superfamily N-acetyltransferase